MKGLLMPRHAIFLAAGFLLVGSLLVAQGPPPATTPVRQLGDPKPFPYQFVLPRPPAAELQARREALAREIENGAVVAISGEKPAVSSHRYSPDHNLYYLTGVDTDFCAMTLIAKDGKVAEVKLFLPAHDSMYELWDGFRVTAGDEARAMSGIEDVVKVQMTKFGTSIKSFEEALTKIAESAKTVYMDAESERRARQPKKLSLDGETRAGRVREFLKSVNPELKVSSLTGAIGPIRGVKSEWEVKVMREAVRVTGEGFVRALRKARPKMWEFDFQSVMDQTFAEWGCTGVPYYPIAASGPNACVYHYVDNRRQIQDGEIVLCDIAAQYGYYAADITRSFPVNGKFTPRQKLVYEAVLAGQTAAAQALKPGVSLGELDGVARAAMRAAGLKDFEMHQHGLGHQIGLNVHDLGGGTMEAGMIITIEPGSYIKSESLGIRIEDMYLVTPTGSECLSAAIPRTVAEIEALVGADYRK
jgi:Xaa-Pro aminopeptidase